MWTAQFGAVYQQAFSLAKTDTAQKAASVFLDLYFFTDSYVRANRKSSMPQDRESHRSFLCHSHNLQDTDKEEPHH